MPASTAVAPDSSAARDAATRTVFAVLFTISFSHLLNDTIQALLPSIYPLLKDSFQLSFGQLGLITFAFQFTASLLQPVVGFVADRRPMPWSLAVGMSLTLCGLVALAFAADFHHILFAAALVGAGSAIFHPEASRIAYMAAGRRRGLAQSVFQVGGNAGSAIGPLLAAALIMPHGQRAVLAFSLVALLGVVVLWRVGRWHRANAHRARPRPSRPADGGPAVTPSLSRRRVGFAVAVLVALTFSKYVYLASLTSYYTFYLIDRFHVSVRSAQIHLFILLAAVAAGTIAGGPAGDRFGRRRVIWVSILGVAPFSLALPHVGLGLTAVLTVFIGLILASAFSAILVYAQELMPGRIGVVSGLFFGLAFGIAGIGSAVLGRLADHTGIGFVFELCAWLPLLGLLTVFLPEIEHHDPSPLEK